MVVHLSLFTFQCWKERWVLNLSVLKSAESVLWKSLVYSAGFSALRKLPHLQWGVWLDKIGYQFGSVHLQDTVSSELINPTFCSLKEMAGSFAFLDSISLIFPSNASSFLKLKASTFLASFLRKWHMHGCYRVSNCVCLSASFRLGSHFGLFQLNLPRPLEPQNVKFLLQENPCNILTVRESYQGIPGFLRCQ